MAKVKVCILRSAGTNCDRETGFAFEKAGASVDYVHINRMISGQSRLSDYEILAFPGGFSYGDDVAAGKIFANELRYKLGDDLRDFLKAGKLIIGICNGFQILVKAGLLPGNADMKQEASLIINDSGKFEDRWVYLRPQGKCVWTKGLKDTVYFPVAHGEGKFVMRDKAALERLKKNNQVVFKYCNKSGQGAGYPDNPNGSAEDIAGICDDTGRILGLMPHPERHAQFTQHPRWTSSLKESAGAGLAIFENGVEYIKKHF
jgi:phosphoribosylformylglycinamidine synthase